MSATAPTPGARSALPRLFILLRPFKWEVALAILLGLCTVGAGVGLMTTSSWLISAAALHPSEAALAVAIVGVRFFGLSRGIFRYLERYVSHDVTFRLLTRIRVWVYDAIEPRAPAWLGAYRSGDLLSRGAADVDTLQHLYVRVISPPAVATVTAALLYIFLSQFDTSIALVAVGTLIVTGVGTPLLARALAHGPERRLVALRTELTIATIDATQGMTDLLAFGRDDEQQERIAALSEDLTKEQQRLAHVAGLSDALLSFGASVALLLTLIVAIPLVAAGHIDGVWLAALSLAVTASFEAIAPLPAAAQHAEGAVAAGERIFALDDTTPAVVEPAHPEPLPEDTTITLSHVSFRYDAGEPLALDDISLSLRTGELVAIIGPSGAGKSTISGLIERFWEPAHGSITLGGIDYERLSADDVRTRMSVITQRTHLFNTSVRQNLLIAKPGATYEEIIDATRLAQIHDTIMSLPQGYDTIIGEQGARLSGGERQRIAIARAFLKDAPILILDEPTAHLDAQTEQNVLAALFGLMRDRATLLITHRLIGLSSAREIIVLRDGRIIERGPHSQLNQAHGPYRAMLDAQSQAIATIPRSMS